MSDKRIFDYQKNGEQVYGDPILLFRRLYAVCEAEKQNFHTLYGSAFPKVPEGQTEPVESYQAKEELYPLVCATFDLPLFDPTTGEGTLIDEAEAVLLSFMDFLSKKNQTPAT